MKKFTVTQFEDEIVATYDADGAAVAIKTAPTGDFLLDVADMILRIEEKIKEMEK